MSTIITDQPTIITDQPTIITDQPTIITDQPTIIIEQPTIITDQPTIIIGSVGEVANGKSSVLREITGTNLMRFKKEAEKNMTIKLGYTNTKIYKCPNCPKPYCYQTHNDKLECKQCDEKLVLCVHVSFVDAPGHNDLQATALSGANNMDYCFLLISTDNVLEMNGGGGGSGYINEHYKAISALSLLDKTLILQNKIDLVKKDKAIAQYELIKSKYNIKNVIPISAQFGYNIEYILQYIVEKIGNPINTPEFNEKINKPLKMSIIRTFDINKPGTNVYDLFGSVIGGTIKQGQVKVGDRVKILPGIIHNNKLIPLVSTVQTIKTDNINLEKAYSGGLIALGLSLDPSLSKEDRLVGNIIVSHDDKNVVMFNNATIDYVVYTQEQLEEGGEYTMMLYTIKRNIKITNINKSKNELTFTSAIQLCGEINDRIVITKNNKILLYGYIKTMTC
jgi:translation initiation factor 2 subunit 3